MDKAIPARWNSVSQDTEVRIEVVWSCLNYSLHLEKYYINKMILYFQIRRYAAAKSLQWCPTLCNPIDSSPPGSLVSGIFQAWTLEWVTFSFPNAWKWKVKVKSISRIRLFATPWTIAYQAPLSMGFSRQEHWSGLPFPSPIYRHICGNLLS